MTSATKLESCSNKDGRVAPVASVDDIRSRCKRLLKGSQFSPISWAGVFGSFSANKKTDSSDVDLLIGFLQDATSDDMYYMGDISQEFSEPLGRDVDCLYLRYQQPFNLVKCLAVMNAQTFYGSEEWRSANFSRASTMLVTCAKKMRAVLNLEKELLAHMACLDKDEFLEAHQLPQKLTSNIEQFVNLLYCGDEDERAMDQYFAPVLRWTLPIKSIAENTLERSLHYATGEERLSLWRALTTDLPEAAGMLEAFYIPILDEALKAAKLT